MDTKVCFSIWSFQQIESYVSKCKIEQTEFVFKICLVQFSIG